MAIKSTLSFNTRPILPNITRRVLLKKGIYAALFLYSFHPLKLLAETFEITKSDDEWKKILTPAQYDVLRQQGTERPYSSPLTHLHTEGIYNCVGCNLPLFSSATKFDSGTGWPSFYAPLPHAVNEATDHSLLMTRTEVHCHRCGGHLGHVFDDGPPPTGQRYCINGVVLNFVPQVAGER